jgi:ABC-type amino acid transport substrate-binding protein
MLGFAAMAACLPRALAAAPVLRITTSQLAPYANEYDRSAPGALHELVQAITERAGVPAQISFVPWKRAVYETHSLPRSAVFPLTRTLEREPAYRWLAELYREEFLFLTVRDGRFNWHAPLQMKQARIGILRGSAMVSTIRTMGFVRVVETNSIQESLRFLEGGIVDALMGDRAIFGHATRSRPDPARFVSSAPIRSTVTWLGGSLDIPEAEAARYQKARADLVADGSYARILKKYGLAP